MAPRPAAAAAPGEARSFIPRHPGRLSPGHRSALSLVGESFSRRAGLSLATRLRTSVDVGPAEVAQQSYADYAAGLPERGCFTVVTVGPTAATGIVHVSLGAALAIVDRLCGGRGEGAPTERPLTEIETSLLGGIVGQGLGDLAASFAPLAGLTFSVLRREDRPQLLKAVPPHTTLVVLRFGIDVQGCAGAIEFAIPFVTIERALDDFVGAHLASPASEGDATTDVADALLGSSIDVSIRFAPVRLTPEEILNLAVGDVVTLSHPTTEPLSLTASHVPLLSAVAGRRGRRLACRIVLPTEEMNH